MLNVSNENLTSRSVPVEGTQNIGMSTDQEHSRGSAVVSGGGVLKPDQPLADFGPKAPASESA